MWCLSGVIGVLEHYWSFACFSPFGGAPITLAKHHINYIKTYIYRGKRPMETDVIGRKEYEEFTRRIEAEETRQNKRLEKLENTYEKLNEMAAALREMAVETKGQREDLQGLRSDVNKMGDRIDSIEKEPADNWKKAVWYIVIFFLGALLALAAKSIGL